MIKVAVVEDDVRFRKSLLRTLQASPGLKCVGEYGSGAEALTELPKAEPDVVMMDLNLPDQSGVVVTSRIKVLLPDLNVIILTVFNDSEHIFEALRAGACGYLLKQSSATEIVEAITLAQSGGSPMTNEIARKVLAAFAEPRPSKEVGESLSPRDKSILELVAQGRSNKEIASQLTLTPKTVGYYLNGIYRKLHVQSRTQAVNKYYPTRPRVGF
jgi:DNA-binding NarL/FixJ family response regulator